MNVPARSRRRSVGRGHFRALAWALLITVLPLPSAWGAMVPYFEDFSSNPVAWSNASAVNYWQWDAGNQRIVLQSSTASAPSAWYTTKVEGVPSSTSGAAFEASIDIKMDVTGTSSALRLILLGDVATNPTSYYMIGVDGWGSTPDLRIRHRPIGGSLGQISGNHALGVANLGTTDWYTLSVVAEWLDPGYDFTVTLTNKTTGNTVGTPLSYTHHFAAGSNNDLSGGEYFGIQTWVTLSGGNFTALADNFAVVPEPASWLLLVFGAGLTVVVRRRRAVRAR